MGRRSLLLAERRGIRDRLSEFQRRHYATRQAMNEDAGVSANTGVGWFAKAPRTPDTASLVRIAERKNLNLNWLLLGEGPELRGVEGAGEVWPQLRRTLVAELVSHGVRRQAAERVIPSEDSLFHMLIAWALERSTKPTRRHVRTRRATIGGELERVLQSMNPPRRRSADGRKG